MRARAAVLALGLLLGGCRTMELAPGPRPLAGDDPRPQALLAQLQARDHALRSVRGRARVSIEGQRGASFARQLVLAERPARLRVEVMGLLGQRIAVLATDGEEYQLYRAEDEGLEVGLVHPDVLLEVAGLPVTPEEAVALLLGTPRATGSELRSEDASLLGDGSVRVVLEGLPEMRRRSLDFDSQGNLRRYALHGSGGALLVEVRYADFRDVGERPFAHRIALDFPAAAVRAEVAFAQVELNPELPSALFRLQLSSAPGA